MTDTAQQIPPHPAKWSATLLPELARIVAAEAERLDRHVSVLDPFAGVSLGRIRDTLGSSACAVVGIELEPEWAAADDQTTVGDATDLPAGWSGMFDMVVTSPTFGNRMADHHEARDGSSRITYRHKLGRPLSTGSSGAMQWGTAYRDLHAWAWSEVARVLRPGRPGVSGRTPRVLGGLAVVNVSNHLRTRSLKGQRFQEEQPVVEWHLHAFLRAGFRVDQVVNVPTPRMGFGANADARVDGERILVLRRPETDPGSMYG